MFSNHRNIATELSGFFLQLTPNIIILFGGAQQEKNGQQKKIMTTFKKLFVVVTYELLLMFHASCEESAKFGQSLTYRGNESRFNFKLLTVGIISRSRSRR